MFAHNPQTTTQPITDLRDAVIELSAIHQEQESEAPSISSAYPLHRGIVATVFWVGEPEGGGSSEDNALSAWDDDWQRNYGGFDDPQKRNGYHPIGFTPKENPFYLDLPYNDFDDEGRRKTNAYRVIPWANEKQWGPRESMMKNRWVKLIRNGITCYGQIQDAGPYEYDDHAYVFGDGSTKPKSTLANNAGLDVSPALRDCLKFNHWNNADNKVDWQFVDAADVPAGPWNEIVTTSQIHWR
ncbi:hypothetical protein JNK62_00675 [bacterium]|nr:hypothetical protein [bacterium]